MDKTRTSLRKIHIRNPAAPLRRRKVSIEQSLEADSKLKFAAKVATQKRTGIAVEGVATDVRWVVGMIQTAHGVTVMFLFNKTTSCKKFTHQHR